MMRAFLRFSALVAAGLVLAYGFGESGAGSDARVWLACLGIFGVLLAIAGWPAGTRRMPIFSRTLMRWMTLIVVAFLLVTVQLVRLQIVDSSATAARVEEAPDGEVVMNPRERIRSLEVKRGRVLDAEGRVLADTVLRDDGTYMRTYPEPTTGPVIGYYSPQLYGSTNLEESFDKYLSGEEGGNPVDEWLDGVLHRTREGYDLKLTLDLDLQQLASDLLGGRPGGVVLMDAKTGAILAMVGAPTFDPNQLYANQGQLSEEQLAAVEDYWAALNADSDAPLLFRPTQGLYTPGSTFKTVTATALLDSGMASPSTVFRDEGIYEVDGRVIEELNRPDPNKVNWTLEEGYAWSLNVVFAQIGLQLGSERLWEYATRFGFEQRIPFDIPTETTQLANEQGNLSNRTLLADTGFGQGQILVSPLQMAMVVAAVANGGEMMQPFLVSDVLDKNGDSVERFGNTVWQRAMSGDTANNMRKLMEASSGYGYATAAQIEGITVGAKTGTAEVGTDEPHSWFTAYGEADGRTLVVAVVVEHGGPGSQSALPIGRDLLAAAFGQ